MGFEEEGVGARAPDREIGLGFGGGYGKITGSTSHPRIHVYLHACECVGCEPSECMAVEDSPNGLRSAYSAGCEVVYIPDLTEPDDETEPITHHVFGDMIEMREYMQSLVS